MKVQKRRWFSLVKIIVFCGVPLAFFLFFFPLPGIPLSSKIGGLVIFVLLCIWGSFWSGFLPEPADSDS